MTVSFPVISRQLGEGQETATQGETVPTRSLPVFNKDRSHFTPSFVLESDKAKVEKNLNFYMDHHFVKLEEASEEKDDILVPKPSKNHSFCGLCRLHFEDYLTHLELEVHRDNLKKAKF